MGGGGGGGGITPTYIAGVVKGQCTVVDGASRIEGLQQA